MIGYNSKVITRVITRLVLTPTLHRTEKVIPIYTHMNMSISVYCPNMSRNPENKNPETKKSGKVKLGKSKIRKIKI